MNRQNQNREEALSRRGFMKAAVIGGAAIATTGSAIVGEGDSRLSAAPRDPLEEIVERFGSELGDVRNVQSTSTA